MKSQPRTTQSAWQSNPQIQEGAYNPKRTQLFRRSASALLLIGSAFFGRNALAASSTTVVLPIATNRPVTYAILSNPYTRGGNTVAEIFSSSTGLIAGTTVYKFNPAGGTYTTTTFNGTWSNPNLVLSPGEGFFLNFNSQLARAAGSTLQLTFSGDPLSSVTLPPGGQFSMVGPPMDKAGLLVHDLGYPISEGDYIYKFNVLSQAYQSEIFTDGEWESGHEPRLAAGEGFFLYRAPAPNLPNRWAGAAVTLPSGQCLSALPIGGTGADYGQAVTVDLSGNAIVGGSFGSHPFLAKRNPAGALLWSIGAGGPGSGSIQAVAADSSGNVYVAGQYGGTLDFGGGPVASAGGYDIFVAKYSSSGAHLWSKRFGSAKVDSFLVESGYGLAVDTNQNAVVVTGIFNGDVDFGGGAMNSSSGQDMFLVKFSANGGHVWSKRVGGGGATAGNSLAVDGNGNIFVTGSFGYTVDFGSGPKTAGGYSDMFIAKYSSAGANLWVKSFGTNAPSKSTSVGTALALDRSGDVAVTGNYQSSMSFGGAVLTSAGYNDIYVAKYSGANGANMWSKSFGGGNYDIGAGVTVDAAGNIVLTGQMGSSLTFVPGSTLQGQYGGVNVFLASFAPDGTPRWSKLGVVGLGNVKAAATSPTGHLFLTGAFTTKADFGAQVITGFNGTDIFLAEFAP